MADDEDLAERIRELIASQRDVTEQPMFGGWRPSSPATCPGRPAAKAA